MMRRIVGIFDFPMRANIIGVCPKRLKVRNAAPWAIRREAISYQSGESLLRAICNGVLYLGIFSLSAVPPSIFAPRESSGVAFKIVPDTDSMTAIANGVSNDALSQLRSMPAPGSRRSVAALAAPTPLAKWRAVNPTALKSLVPGMDSG